MKIKLIPDKELETLEKDDMLGTMPYVDTLYETIKECETPFNIGLLAGWGGGKSSIVETLLDKIKTENKSKKEKDFLVFKYDAWKYSEDPFRRTFIIELLNEFKIKGFDNLDSLLYDNSSTENEGATKFNTLRVVKYLYLAPLLILFFWFSSGSPEVKKVLTGISFVSSLFLFLLKEMFTTYKITIHKSKIIEPEKFESIFEEIVSRILEKKRSVWNWMEGFLGIEKEQNEKKLLIVIDNIDRCHEELVIQLLLTIKNFLDKKHVIFILPIDENGVTFFLKNSNQNATEFLRKIFNTTIRIKSFSNDEMFDYAWQLVKNYGLDKEGVSKEVVQLACQEYTANPRKIIQFLNNFQLSIFLVKQQETRKYLKDEQVSGNLDFLAKLEILREEWPDLYNEIFHKQHWITRIDRGIRDDTFAREIDKYVLNNQSEKIILDERQYWFFRRTRSIVAKGSIEPFLVNRDLLKDIPDNINGHITNNNWTEIAKIAKEDNLQFESIKNALVRKYDTDVTKRKLYSSAGVSLFLICNQIIQDSENEKHFSYFFDNKELKFLKELISSKQFEIEFSKFGVNDIFPLMKWLTIKKEFILNEKIGDLLISEIIEQNSNEYRELLTQYIMVNKQQKKYLRKISLTLSNIISHITEFLTVINPVLENKSIVENLIKVELYDELINVIAEKFNNKEEEPIIEFLRINQEFGLLTIENKENYINKITPIIHGINDWNIIPRWYKLFEGFAFSDFNINTINNLKSYLKEKQNFLCQQFKSGLIEPVNIECYKAQISICFKIINEKYENQPQYLTWINQFMHSRVNEEIYRLIISELKISIEESHSRDFDLFDFSYLIHNSKENFEKIEIFQIIQMYISNQDDLKTSILTIHTSHLRDLFFANFDDFKESFTNWINEFSKISGAKEIILPIVNEITLPNNRRTYLKIIDGLNDNELHGNIISDILTENQNDPIEIFKNVQDIVAFSNNGKKLVNEKLTEIINNNTQNVDILKIYIDFILDKWDYFQADLVNLATNHLTRFLSNNNLADWKNFVERLNNLDAKILTDDNKGLVKSLMKTSTIELDDEDKKNKNSLIKKFK